MWQDSFIRPLFDLHVCIVSEVPVKRDQMSLYTKNIQELVFGTLPFWCLLLRGYAWEVKMWEEGIRQALQLQDLEDFMVS